MDIQEIKAHADNPGETFPMEVVLDLSKGNNPIKVFREYRGITQAALANKTQISKQYISQLENGERNGTIKILKAIAAVLRVDIHDIT